jgi:hypothetical protein|tara:strand:+ start:227 stop:727 length:501 start_codon:yes stop_codon:yes gene_type:complete
MSKYNNFDAPIPGQSLTDTPGNYPWEHSPNVTRVEDAMMYLTERFTEEENAQNLVSMLKAGVPVEAIARVVLFAGFTEGKWSVDLAILIGEPLMKLIAAIGSRLGLKEMYISMKRKKKTNVGDEMIVRNEVSKSMEDIEEELSEKEDTEEKEPMPIGLMSKEEEIE